MKKESVLAFVVLVVILISIVSFIFNYEKVSFSPLASKTTTYIHAGNLLASKSSGEDYQYYIQDHLGSNRRVVDGGISEDDNYASGEEKFSNSDSDYKFTGKELDDTGLYYYGARYYLPEIGRFVQADALTGQIGDPLSLNRYAYVSNNPLKYVDPTGNDKQDPKDQIIGKSSDTELLWGLITIPGNPMTREEVTREQADKIRDKIIEGYGEEMYDRVEKEASERVNIKRNWMENQGAPKDSIIWWAHRMNYVQDSIMVADAETYAYEWDYEERYFDAKSKAKEMWKNLEGGVKHLIQRKQLYYAPELNTKKWFEVVTNYYLTGADSTDVADMNDEQKKATEEYEKYKEYIEDREG